MARRFLRQRQPLGRRTRDLAGARDSPAPTPRSTRASIQRAIPDAKREVAGIIEYQKDPEHHGRPASKAEDQQRDQRTQRQPPSPHESVADAAERSAQRGTEALDAVGRYTRELHAS